tara:strand:+ start:1192 stop:1983 length:792 start_codon:yes stop_codon:yes gene_type:complete
MTDNTFEQHGISHVSPSMLNLYVDNREKWAIKYLLKCPTSQKPVFWRGTAVDTACGRLFGMLEDQEQKDKEDCQILAVEQYFGLAQHYQEEGLEIDTDEVTKEAQHLDTYVELALDHYSALGKPAEYQKPIQLELEQCPVPIIGYLDFLYEDERRVVRDLKTTARKPDLRKSVARQLAVYAQAEQAHPIVDYVYVNSRAREVMSIEVNDWESHLLDVRGILHSMNNLLSISNDTKEIIGLMYPDYEKWSWDVEEIAYAKTVWR